MSLNSLLWRRPTCQSCCRRLVGKDAPAITHPPFIQVRGKKKTSRGPNVVNVRLLVDVKGYGKKGTITPVSRGLMRNYWFRQHQAEYLSTAADINPRTVVAQRDFNFGLSDVMAEQKRPEVDLTPLRPQIKLPTAAEALELLTTLLPPLIVFQRAAIAEAAASLTPPQPKPSSPPASTEPPSPSKQRKSRPSMEPTPTETTSNSTPSGQTQSSFRPRAIFGSVTPAEIATSMTAAIQQHQQHEQARLIVIAAEDVTIVSRADVDIDDDDDAEGKKDNEKEKGDLGIGIEDNRIKALGEYWVDVRVRGAATTTTTTISSPSGSGSGKKKTEGVEDLDEDIEQGDGDADVKSAGVVRRVVRVE